MDLKVQIPKRYMDSLERRWNIDKFYLKWSTCINDQPCVLCKVHNTNNGCNNCPFARFDRQGRSYYLGCIKWLKLIKAKTRNCILGIGSEGMSFDEKKYKIAVRQLKRIRDVASQYIEWV